MANKQIEKKQPTSSTTSTWNEGHAVATTNPNSIKASTNCKTIINMIYFAQFIENIVFPKEPPHLFKTHSFYIQEINISNCDTWLYVKTLYIWNDLTAKNKNRVK